MTGAQLTAGAVVPALTRTIEQADMVAYAGATWDWHRMHYDPAYLAEKHFERAVVDGQVFGALLAEQVQDWLGERVRLTRLHFRFRNLVFAGETVKCTGTVTAVEPQGDGLAKLTIESQVAVVGDDPRVAVAPAGAVALWRP